MFQFDVFQWPNLGNFRFLSTKCVDLAELSILSNGGRKTFDCVRFDTFEIVCKLKAFGRDPRTVSSR